MASRARGAGGGSAKSFIRSPISRGQVEPQGGSVERALSRADSVCRVFGSVVVRMVGFRPKAADPLSPIAAVQPRESGHSRTDARRFLVRRSTCWTYRDAQSDNLQKTA